VLAAGLVVVSACFWFSLCSLVFLFLFLRSVGGLLLFLFLFLWLLFLLLLLLSSTLRFLCPRLGYGLFATDPGAAAVAVAATLVPVRAHAYARGNGSNKGHRPHRLDRKRRL